MKLTEKDAQSFAKTALNNFNLADLNLNHEKAMKFLKKELSEEFEELNQNEVKRARAAHFKIGKPDDYAEKILSLSNDRKLIYGIRHKGGNRDISFVSLRANFELFSKKEVLEIYGKILSEVNVFEPRFVVFHSKRKGDADFFGQVEMVGGAKEVKSIDPWGAEESLALVPIVDESFYDWYCKGYKKFHQQFPDLAAKVPVNSLSVMKESQDQGLLCWAYLDGAKVGVIAALRRDFLGHPGIYFNEIFISEENRGKGLAKAIQRKFVEENAKDDELVWGTIDSGNLSSFKTASANGRRPLRFECFINIEGDLQT